MSTPASEYMSQNCLEDYCGDCSDPGCWHDCHLPEDDDEYPDVSGGGVPYDGEEATSDVDAGV